MMERSRKTTSEERESSSSLSEVVVDENIGGFCSINERTGKREELGLREKEQLFLATMQRYYLDGTSTLSNEEFDTLKEELTWQGSEVVTLSRDEFLFLDAAKAFETGHPIMSDDDFDDLKTRLKRAGSVVALQRGPRCSIKRQVTFSDVVPDTKRTLALYTPAFIGLALAWLSGTYELTPLRDVDPVICLIIGTPFIYFGAKCVCVTRSRDSRRRLPKLQQEAQCILRRCS